MPRNPVGDEAATTLAELLTRLSRIQRSISRHAPLRDVLDSISEGASELLGDPIAGVALIDPQSPGQLHMQSLIGLDRGGDEARPQPIGAEGRAISADSLVVIDDVQAEGEMNELFVEAGVRAAMAAPIREGGAIAGALVVASRTEGRSYSEAERQTLTAFADHAGLALTDARLSDQVERALHDPLTGLPNRSFLSETLATTLEDASPELICLDLDRFRAVNDRIGQRGADKLLIELAERLRAVVAEGGDLVTRLEGDTFGMLSTAGNGRQLAERILGAFAEPFRADGRELRLGASLGVVESGSDAEQMLRDADLAMYRAKSEGGSRFVVFEPGMHAELVKRLELQDDLARALSEGEIQAHFQPKVDLRGARVIGVEALVRWEHPERGLVLPADFLDLADAGGYMRALTERVLEFCTRAASDWWHSGLGLQLSVNLAASTFSEPDWRIDEFVKRTLARTGLPGEALQFEVTEDALMADPEAAAEILNRLSQLGATISIDDFGTGHSSLGRLKSLPIDELKIDRSFIADLTTEEDKTIVRSTIHLAHQMGLQVVAEGVETEEAWRQLRSMGCERAQGFLISKPLSAREVPAWFASWNQRARQLSSARRVRRRKRVAATQQAERATA